MTHLGGLGTHTVSEKVHDIRGSEVRSADDVKLGKVSDVIFDHDTMEIRYVVVDSDGWLEARTFLLPADLISSDQDNEDSLVANVTARQVENSPQYDNETAESEDEWKKYEQEFKKYWDEEPIMHMKGSDRIVTPPEEPTPAEASSRQSQGRGSADRELNAADLFPERISNVFSDPAPKPGKVTLRPKSVARAEEAATGVTLLKPAWWESFENYLRVNKEDIRSQCPQCESKAA